jgi:hypothetical protein
VDARIHGIGAQVGGTSAEVSHYLLRKHADIFDTPSYAAYASVDPRTQLVVPSHSYRPRTHRPRAPSDSASESASAGRSAIFAEVRGAVRCGDRRGGKGAVGQGRSERSTKIC